jgi:3-hydroxybutyryl-CoA dehydrogenase
MENRIERVAVIGTGQMGPGIAVATTLAGCRTVLVGRTRESVDAGLARYKASTGFLVEQGAITAAEAAAATAILAVGTDIGVAADTDLTIESIIEHLPAKQGLFQELDAICPIGVILGSNTSGLRISDISRDMRHPERAVTTHFWNPGHLMPLVEVIKGEHTSERTVQSAVEFLLRCGKRPVVGRKDVPGQICNRILQAVIRECVFMVEQGIASAEDVETALKNGAGLRFPVYGPLEHLDAIGLDLALAVQKSVLPSLCNDSRPGRLLEELVENGNLGSRTGRGFHDWDRRSVEELRRTRDLWLVQRMKEARE